MKKESGLVNILERLPPPLAVYTSPHARFEVYRAKDMYVSKWNNPALKDIVRECRKSYLRYGKRPLFDLTDRKAAIYAVRVFYKEKHQSQSIEEWLSLHIVPGDGSPRGVFEPEIYWHNGRRVDQIMKQKIGARNFWKHVASSSRMCGIHPYKILKNGDIAFLENESHAYTPVCFALMHKQFISDYPLARFPYRYITGIMRDDFHQRGLVYRTAGRVFRPTLTKAHHFLGIRRGMVKVKRDAYSYEFPLYWFDAKKLLNLINRLRVQQHQEKIARLEPDMLSNLSKHTERILPIAGVRIRPGEMRFLIDKEVPDAPELRITEANSWYRSMERLLRAAKVVVYN